VKRRGFIAQAGAVCVLKRKLSLTAVAAAAAAAAAVAAAAAAAHLAHLPLKQLNSNL